ncbi:MAG: hypothetical protein LBQ83_06025 [Candidatus Margulisbacteria bacterium]|nr:hypothetical protein [Candidatus Margulisiibacteriota bacterium]
MRKSIRIILAIGVLASVLLLSGCGKTPSLGSGGGDGGGYVPTQTTLTSETATTANVQDALNDYDIVNLEAAAEIEFTADAVLTVPEGKTLVLKDEAIITFNAGANVTLNGDIVLENGARLIDTNPAGGTVWNGNGTGSITYKPGSESWVDGSKWVAEDGEVVALGDDGVFKIERTAYTIVEGTVTSKIAQNIGSDYDVQTVTIQSGAVLELEADLNIYAGGVLNKNGTTVVETSGEVKNNGGTINE